MRTRDREQQLVELRRCLQRAIEERQALGRELTASRDRERASRASRAELRADAIRLAESLRQSHARLEEAENARGALLGQLELGRADAERLRSAIAGRDAELHELSAQLDQHGRALAQSRRELERCREQVALSEALVREAATQSRAANERARRLEDESHGLRARLSAAESSLARAEAAHRQVLDDLTRSLSARRRQDDTEARRLSERVREAEAETVAARETLDNWATRVKQAKSRELLAVARAEREATVRIERARAESDELRDALGFVSEVMSTALRRACGRAAPIALRAALAGIRLNPPAGATTALRERMTERLLGLLDTGARPEGRAGRLLPAERTEPEVDHA